MSTEIKNSWKRISIFLFLCVLALLAYLFTNIHQQERSSDEVDVTLPLRFSSHMKIMHLGRDVELAEWGDVLEKSLREGKIAGRGKNMQVVIPENYSASMLQGIVYELCRLGVNEFYARTEEGVETKLGVAGSECYRQFRNVTHDQYQMILEGGDGQVLKVKNNGNDYSIWKKTINSTDQPISWEGVKSYDAVFLFVRHDIPAGWLIREMDKAKKHTLVPPWPQIIGGEN
jgi:hypothetical protein